jgi:uncharacterized protein YhjY with autotransporter beta-barrel domain
MLRSLRLVSVSTVALWAASAAANPVQVTAPNVTNDPGAVSKTLEGNTFINQGLVGTGSVSAQAKDYLGDSLGSFSSMAIDLNTWRRNADGTYSGTIFTLPDRGYNKDGFFSDYAGRLNRFGVSFNPYYGTASTTPTQLVLTPDGGITLLDANGNKFTGLDPNLTETATPLPAGNTNVGTQLGALVPMASTGTAAGRIALDAEGLALKPDGSFYVSDEYGANIYYFDASGHLLGIINPPKALLPTVGGNTFYDSVNPPQTGRRNNQGLESIAITPDGKKLVTILQSATTQDSDEAAGQQARANTRIIVYDISKEATPGTPVEHYVLQLPVFNRGNTNGTVTSQTPNRTAAQSEMLALNDKQFLVLSRDGNGRGNGGGSSANGGSDGRPLVFKSILLVDTSQATNLAGTPYETSTTPVSPGGVLSPSITPVEQVELVNMINPTQLGRLGLNTNATPANSLSVSEKWESMGIAPTLEENKPQDVFLFVGNDNDFLSTDCVMQGRDCDNQIDNDSRMLIYRLTLPTYVDPMYFQAMMQGAPIVAAAIASSALEMSRGAERDVEGQLAALRRGGSPAWTASRGLWISGNATVGDDDAKGASSGTGDLKSGSVGIDGTLAKGVRAGLAGTYTERSGNTGYGFDHDARGAAVSAYAGYFQKSFYAQALLSYAPTVELSKITRPGAYGLTAVGDTNGDSASFAFEAGLPFAVSGVLLTPFAGLAYTTARIDGYTEHGAAGGNVAYDQRNVKDTVARVGAEATAVFSGITSSLRVAYTQSIGDDADYLKVSLASSKAALATQQVLVPFYEEQSVDVGVGLQGSFSPAVGWRLNYDARIGVGSGENDVNHAVGGAIRVGY